MKPYYEADGIAIYHGDCTEIAPTLGRFDLIAARRLGQGVLALWAGA